MTVSLNFQLPRGQGLYIELLFTISLQIQQLNTLAQSYLLLDNGFLIYITFRRADPTHANPMRALDRTAEKVLNMQFVCKLEVSNNLSFVIDDRCCKMKLNIIW